MAHPGMIMMKHKPAEFKRLSKTVQAWQPKHIPST